MALTGSPRLWRLAFLGCYRRQGTALALNYAQKFVNKFCSQNGDKVRHSLKIGFSFGLTSGIITTLGLMVGLHSGTHSKTVVVGGILTIAVADAISDALGIHFSEESEGIHCAKEIWEATIATFLFKLVCALTFLFPVVCFQLPTAIAISIFWGLFLLTILTYYIAKDQEVETWKAILEHLGVAVVVIFVTHNLGEWISAYSTH